MKCPKCNTQLEDKTIKCPVCGTRIGRLCPVCKNYNIITSKVCSSCGEVLLKLCPNCKSINLPTSKLCRKCGVELDNNLNDKNNESLREDNESFTYQANYYSMDNAEKTIIDSINAKNIKIVSVNGENELGKTYIFNQLKRDTAELGYAWLGGKCTPHTQLTPLGFIQDLLLNLFNVTNFCTSKQQLKKESIKFFKQDFPDLSVDEIYILLNILYPENIDQFQNIENNKQKTIRVVKKIFETILSKMSSILVVENIEYIDSFSYELLNVLILDDFIRDKITIILSFEKEQSGINILSSPSLNDNNYIDVSIVPFSKEQIIPIFNNYDKSYITDDLQSKILHFAKNNPIIVEQLINSSIDALISKTDILLSDNIKDIIQFRLSILKQQDENLYKLLIAFAILGYKFNPLILNSIFNLDFSSIQKSINKLVKMNYLSIINDTTYEFKTLNIWSAIIEIIKLDKEIFIDVNKSLYPLLNQYVLSTTAILGFISQNLELEDQAFGVWSHCSQLAAYIGDTGLYIILNKQLLNIIDKVNLVQKESIKRTLYSELGKLLEPENPALAMDYLPKAIMLMDDSDFIEKIELLGYLASCSMKQKNYHGVIECIDNVISLIPDNFPVEVAVIKSREIKPLLKMGNCGLVINMIENDILPIFEQVLSNKVVCKTISLDIIFNIWLNVQLDLAQALIMQGNSKSLLVLEHLVKICNENNIDDKKIFLNINILIAFANTMLGDVRTSIKILDEILSQEENISPEYMSQINLISILNRYFMNRDDLTSEELFQATQYADNINDDFVKNILKLILGSIIQDRTSAKEAANIYTVQIEYFAEKQNAVGVLLGWYLISKAKMVIDGPNSALDIVVKALDIAESANISNQYFVLLFNKLLAEIYLAMQDFEMVKMYIEKALIIAKNFNIKYQLVDLYLLYSKYLQDYALVNKENKGDLVLSSQQLIKKAGLIADELKLLSLSSAVERANTVLISFCQMNGIVLK